MHLPDFFPSNSEELSGLHDALKTRVLLAIESHFLTFPEPVNNIDASASEPNYLQLLTYSVVVTEQSEAYVTELRADGFSYETHYDETGREDYATLGVSELIALLGVLEESTRNAAIFTPIKAVNE